MVLQIAYKEADSCSKNRSGIKIMTIIRREAITVLERINGGQQVVVKQKTFAQN